MHYDVNGVPLFDGKQMNRSSQFSVKKCYQERMVLPKEGCASGATLYDTLLSLPFPLPAKREGKTTTKY